MSLTSPTTAREPGKRRIDGPIPEMQNVLLDTEYCEEERDAGLDYDAGRVTLTSLTRLLGGSTL